MRLHRSFFMVYTILLRLIVSTLPIIGLRRKSHCKREQSKAHRQRQRPQTQCGFARRPESAAEREAGDHWQSTSRSAARLGHSRRIASAQHRADIYREARDVTRHHCRGRRSGKRKLHECILYGHCRDTEHARKDRIGCNWVYSRSRHNAGNEKSS